MSRGLTLKEDLRSTWVVRTPFNSRDVVVKRYNQKGVLHSLGRTVLGSRARSGWPRSHLPQSTGIASLSPLALVDVYCGLLLWRSYLLCEYIPAENLQSLLEREATAEEPTEAAQKIRSLLDAMSSRRITRGDLKPENFLLGEDRVSLVDIDQMRMHVSEETLAGPCSRS
jgi:serine/threonine protein kinase